MDEMNLYLREYSLLGSNLLGSQMNTINFGFNLPQPTLTIESNTYTCIDFYPHCTKPKKCNSQCSAWPKFDRTQDVWIRTMPTYAKNPFVYNSISMTFGSMCQKIFNN